MRYYKMAEYTTNYKLIKPDETDFYDVKQFNQNSDIIDSELSRVYTELFQSGVDGKALLTQSINAKGGTIVRQGDYPTFSELSDGVLSIPNNYPQDLTKSWENFASPSLELIGQFWWTLEPTPIYAIRTPEDFGRAAIMSKTESIVVFALLNDLDLYKYRTTFPGPDSGYSSWRMYLYGCGHTIKNVYTHGNLCSEMIVYDLQIENPFIYNDYLGGIHDNSMGFFNASTQVINTFMYNPTISITNRGLTYTNTMLYGPLSAGAFCGTTPYSMHNCGASNVKFIINEGVRDAMSTGNIYLGGLWGKTNTTKTFYECYCDGMSFEDNDTSMGTGFVTGDDENNNKILAGLLIGHIDYSASNYTITIRDCFGLRQASYIIRLFGEAKSNQPIQCLYNNTFFNCYIDSTSSSVEERSNGITKIALNNFRYKANLGLSGSNYWQDTTENSALSRIFSIYPLHFHANY